MKLKLSFFCFILSLAFTATAQRLSITEPTDTTNEWEYAADGIARLCPAPLWDNWVLRDIEFDKDSNTMYFLLQLPDWKQKDDPTEAQLRGTMKFLVKNIEKGYQSISYGRSVFVDGDWMVYLCVGNLIKKLVDNNINIQFIFLKPLKSMVIDKTLDFKLTPTQVKEIIDSLYEEDREYDYGY